MPGRGCDHLPRHWECHWESSPSCFRLSPPGQSERSRPGWRHCAPRRSCRCQSSWCAAKDNAPGGGQCACPAASTRPQLFQGPGPTVGRWSQDAGSCQICCRGGGSPNPKRAGAPGCRRPGPSTGQQEMGYHPTVTFPVGLSSWQPLPLPSVPSWPRGAGPPAPPPVLFWRNLGALCGQQKPQMPRLAAVGMKCSEAWEPRGRASVWLSTFKRDNRL